MGIESLFLETGGDKILRKVFKNDSVFEGTNTYLNLRENTHRNEIF